MILLQEPLYFFVTLTIFLGLIARWVAYPLYQLIFIDKELNDEEAAKQIGQYFPNVKDKLLNLLPLQQISKSDNDLILASIEQKTDELKLVSFDKAIELKRTESI